MTVPHMENLLGEVLVIPADQGLQHPGETHPQFFCEEPGQSKIDPAHSSIRGQDEIGRMGITMKLAMDEDHREQRFRTDLCDTMPLLSTHLDTSDGNPFDPVHHQYFSTGNVEMGAWDQHISIAFK